MKGLKGKMKQDSKIKVRRYAMLGLIFAILSIFFIFPLFKWHFLPFGDDMDFNFDRIIGLKENLLHLNSMYVYIS